MEQAEMVTKPKLQVVQCAPMSELAAQDLIARFESDIRFGRRKPAYKYEHSDAAKELLGRGRKVAKTIIRHLDTKRTGSLDMRLTWNLLIDDINKADPDAKIPRFLIPKG